MATETRRLAIQRNKAYMQTVNSETVCIRCKRQPVEWHNPEHVKPGRTEYRISNMVRHGRSLDAIKAELERCVPLCRRCHMLVDGRLGQGHRKRIPQS